MIRPNAVSVKLRALLREWFYIRQMVAKIWAVVPAGGVGTRMNCEVPKQYLQLAEQPVIVHTLDRLCRMQSVDCLVVGVAKQDKHWRSLEYQSSKLAGVVDAGKERVDTVENCLKHIVANGGQNDWALVHDAARPCVRTTEIQYLIDTVLRLNKGGILAVPLSDTIKRGVPDSGDALILETVLRDNLWRAMTPQIFKVAELLSSIELARAKSLLLTDEASAIEAVGGQPLLVVCSPDNIKITLPQDIALARLILEAQNSV